jgi:sortase A
LADKNRSDKRKQEEKGSLGLPHYFFAVGTALVITFALLLFSFHNTPADLTNPPEDADPEPVTGPIQTTPELEQFNLIIEKLDISAPIVQDVDGGSLEAYTAALQEGVAHYQGTALPGQGSNTFIFAHSSTITGQEKYAKVFATLDNLEAGDQIIIQHNNKEFLYTVSNKKIVEKDDTSVLKPTPEEQLNLMTCWPINTNQKRLIVTADLVSEKIITK